MSNRARLNGAVSRLALASLFFGVAVPTAWSQCRYEIELIDLPPCGDEGQPVSIAGGNNNGAAGGTACLCGCPIEVDPFLWTPDRGAVILPLPSGETLVDIADIGPANEVVGSYIPEPGFFRWPVVWTAGRAEFLPMITDATSGHVTSINDDGLMVGYCSDPGVPGLLTTTVVWDHGQATDLKPDFAPYPTSRGFAVSDNSLIVGSLWVDPVTRQRGYVWRDREVTVIPAWEGVQDASSLAVSDRGVVVGRSITPNLAATGLGWMWSEQDGTTILPTPDGADVTTIPYGVNDADQIVGWADVDPLPIAVMWVDGEVISLNSLIELPDTVHLYDARAVNDAGQIFGTALQLATNGSAVGFVLTPVGIVPADVTIDCTVDLADLTMVLEDWGKTETRSDVDGNGVVGAEDLAAVLAAWDS